MRNLYIKCLNVFVRTQTYREIFIYRKQSVNYTFPKFYVMIELFERKIL